MAQQTAVEWLINEIENKGDALENVGIRRVQISIDVSDYLELKRKAKQMEKKHIIDSYGIGHNDGCAYMSDGKFEFEGPEQYYNETFGK